MQKQNISSAEVIYSFVIENTTTDAVADGGNNYYGGVIYSGASASNPMWKFEPTSLVVKSSANAIKPIETTFQNPNTGFFGVEITGPAVGDVITIAGVFVKPTSDKITFGPSTGGSPVSSKGKSSGINFGSGTQVFI